MALIFLTMDMSIIEYDMDNAKENFPRIDRFEIPDELTISYVDTRRALITYKGHDRAPTAYKPFLTRKVRYNGTTVCADCGYILVVPISVVPSQGGDDSGSEDDSEEEDNGNLYSGLERRSIYIKGFETFAGKDVERGYIIYSPDKELYEFAGDCDKHFPFSVDDFVVKAKMLPIEQ